MNLLKIALLASIEVFLNYSTHLFYLLKYRSDEYHLSPDRSNLARFTCENICISMVKIIFMYFYLTFKKLYNH